MTNDKVKEYIRKMNAEWAFRWCEPTESGCACMGCANSSGGLFARGVTKEQWKQCLMEMARDA